MYLDNEEAVSNCIEDTTRDIWVVIRTVLAREARQCEVEKAVEQAKYLSLYIKSYEARGYSKLPPTSLWLAKEITEAVQDLID